ncbi:MAG: MFS transporter [Opitutaceae bacterium]
MSLPPPPVDALHVEKPTRVRYKVAGLAFLLAMVTYLDRVCIATLAPSIMADFSLSKVQMGYVFSAFALAYAVFEIPTAHYADRIGTRAILTRIVLWWSAFTIATGAAFNYVSLLVARFLFGAGEAGAWPCAARTFARWIPKKERGTVQGMFFSAAYFSGAMTPLLVSFLHSHLSWRWVLVLFGCVGLIWATVWHLWFRNEPAEHPGVNVAERDLIAAGCDPLLPHPKGGQFWRKILLNRNVLALCLMYFPNSFVFYFCITWLPTYLRERHQFTDRSLDVFTGLPLIFGMVGVVVGGYAMDRLTARYGERVGRCGLGAAAYSVAAVCLLLAPFSGAPIAAAVLISIAMAGNTFTLSAAWNTCIDIGGNNAGVVSATMNTAGQVGSLLCPLIVAYTLKWFNNWDISIFIMSALFFIGALCWGIINPGKKLHLHAAPV